MSDVSESVSPELALVSPELREEAIARLPERDAPAESPAAKSPPQEVPAAEVPVAEIPAAEAPQPVQVPDLVAAFRAREEDEAPEIAPPASVSAPGRVLLYLVVALLQSFVLGAVIVGVLTGFTFVLSL